MQLRIAGVEPESIVDGPGLRYVVFTQGCDHKCPGCQNPHTHDEAGGELIGVDELLADIISRRLLQGVTFSGGEPFFQAKPLAILGRELKKRRLDIITYTGFLFEELVDMSSIKPDYLELLELTDWLIDGPFIATLRDFQLPYRGSTNQRIIDVPQSLRKGVPYQAKLA